MRYGNIIYTATGQTAQITSVNSGTSLTVSPSQTVTAGSSYIIYYTTNNNNTVVGANAGLNTFIGNGITLVGYNAGMDNCSGFGLTGVGYQALACNTTASGNSAFGYNCLTANVGGTAYNIGTASQSTTTITGVGTTFTTSMVGGIIVFANAVQAPITAFVSTTSLTSSVSQTVASQTYTIYYGPAYTTGTVGQSNYTVTGSGTTFLDCFTGGYIVYSTGLVGFIISVTSSTSMQVSPAQTVTAGSTFTIFYSGSGNSGFGHFALAANILGSANTASGYRSLSAVTTGTNNTANGFTSGNTITTGSDNTLVGNAAQAFSTASQCTIVGSTATVSGTAAGTTVIGYGATSSAANATAIGNAVSNSVANSVLLGENAVPLARFEVPGTVTQTTNLTTGVTVNAAQGQITLFSAIPATTVTRFTVSNDRVQATSVINATAQSVGSGTGLPTSVSIMSMGAGTFDIIVYNPDSGATTAAPIIHYQVLYPAL
jgi:hypothetical protein